MPSPRPPRPLPDDAALRRHLAGAELPALLMTAAHLTGDTSLLRDDLRAPGWLYQPQGGLSAVRQREVRRLVCEALARSRAAGRTPGPPAPALLRAITTWATGSDTGGLLELLAEEIALPEDDPRAPGWTVEQVRPGGEFDAAVIGAGFSGLLAAHRLAQAGVRVTVYEKNPDVGGTWLENTYPGCRTDVASHLYNYSFAPRADWPDHFARRDSVLAYLRDFAKDSGAADRIRFGTEVTEMRWEEDAHRWHLTLRGPDGTTTGAVHRAVISAVGQLNRPSLPAIEGLGSFTGPAFHSAAWDHSADLTGKRVAVIGTGASAYQIVPELAGTASKVIVFQRTPPWLRPTPHYHEPLPDSTAWLCEHLPYYAQWYRFWLFAPGLRGILDGWIVDRDHPPTERAVSALNERLRASLLASMEAQLTDAPRLREAVIPRYPVGAKRVLRDNGVWLATLKRDDVRLVTAAVERETPAGVVADGEEFAVDALVYATGFQASRFLAPMKVTGEGGRDLHAHWAGAPRAHLGMTVPGFPNLFCLYGPNTNLVGQGGSIVWFSECAVRYVLDAIRLLLARGADAVSVREEAYDAYNAWVDAAGADRAWVFSTAGGWYKDGARSAVNWPFSAAEYWTRTRRADPADLRLVRTPPS
ncbi:monooxygenase [Streptomyces fumigatiscleroticus]|nr:monooxygenase [Streptomyces fumigatiscleroticus]